MAHRCPIATLQTWLEPAKITDLSAFKAKAVREKDRADFEAVLPRMSSAQRAWLHTALERVHPDHDWISATE